MESHWENSSSNAIMHDIIEGIFLSSIWKHHFTQVMPCFSFCKNVIILRDSWYAKKDLAPQPTGKRGRPAKHGKRLSLEEDFVLSTEKIGDYYLGVR